MRSLLFSFVFLSISSVSAHAADEPLPTEISKYLAKQGPVIEQKTFNSSTQNQLIVYFCIDDNLPGGKNEGASNPANAYCEVALFSKKSKQWALGDKQFLGQGAVKSFFNNILVTESVTYAKEDPLCCPSIKKLLTFNTQQGKLNNVKP